MDNQPMKNKSMLGELDLSSWDIFKKQTNWKNGNTLGITTPLGHSYSLVLETLAKEGLDHTPHPMEFLKFTIDYLSVNGRSDVSREVSMMGFSSPTANGYGADAVMAYMWKLGVSEEACSKTMEAILGRETSKFSEQAVYYFGER
jgi:hypothetical protein